MPWRLSHELCLRDLCEEAEVHFAQTLPAINTVRCSNFETEDAWLSRRGPGSVCTSLRGLGIDLLGLLPKKGGAVLLDMFVKHCLLLADQLLSGNAQAFVDLENVILVRDVDQFIPANRCARLLQVASFTMSKSSLYFSFSGMSLEQYSRAALGSKSCFGVNSLA